MHRTVGTTSHQPQDVEVRAHLALGQFDGAAETLIPVLDTAPEHRVQPLLQRLDEVHAQAAASEQWGERHCAPCAKPSAISNAMLSSLS